MSTEPQYTTIENCDKCDGDGCTSCLRLVIRELEDALMERKNMRTCGTCGAYLVEGFDHSDQCRFAEAEAIAEARCNQRPEFDPEAPKCERA